MQKRSLKDEDLFQRILVHIVLKKDLVPISSGSTACRRSAVVHFRMGWIMPGVGYTYYRYEAAGDQYVVRCVSGLPIPDKKFAILPPRFICHLEHDLPSLHPLWNTVLFRFDHSVDIKKEMVVCGFSSHDGDMQSTLQSGITTHFK